MASYLGMHSAPSHARAWHAPPNDPMVVRPQPPSSIMREEGMQNVHGIHHTFFVKDWEAGYQRRIELGSVIFAQRRFVGDISHTVLTLWQVQDVLRRCAVEARTQELRRAQAAGLPDVVATSEDISELLFSLGSRFNGRVFNSEDADAIYRRGVLDMAAVEQDGNGALPENVATLLDKLKDDAAVQTAAELRLLTSLEDANHSFVRYLGGHGIKRFYNLLGVAVANNREGTAATRTSGYDASRNGDMVRSDMVALTVNVRRHSENVINYWAPDSLLQEALGHQLYFCVQPRPDRLGFCLRPWYGTGVYTDPSLAVTSYTDERGMLQIVEPYMLGTLKGTGLEGRPESSAADVQAACGIESSPSQAHDAAGLVSRLTVELAVSQ